MTRCVEAWCPGSLAATSGGDDRRSDGEYENHIAGNDAPGVIIKQYEREARFDTEVLALRLLAPLGLSPELRGLCTDHRTVRMSRIAAAPLARSLIGEADDERTAAAIGVHLRALHGVRVPGVGPLNALSNDSWPGFLRRHLAGRLESLPLTERDLDRTRSFLESQLAALDAGLTPRILHHDIKPANLLLSPSGRVALCDFDQARGGDPLSDLGKLWWRTFAGSLGGAWRAFLHAYGCRVNEVQVRVEFYLIVHCLGALAYWHDYARPRYRDHARAARELLAERIDVLCPLEHDEGIRHERAARGGGGRRQ